MTKRMNRSSRKISRKESALTRTKDIKVLENTQSNIRDEKVKPSRTKKDRTARGKNK